MRKNRRKFLSKYCLVPMDCSFFSFRTNRQICLSLSNKYRFQEMSSPRCSIWNERLAFGKEIDICDSFLFEKCKHMSRWDPMF